MNRILFEANEISPDNTVTLRDIRADHIRKVLHGAVGQRLKTGTVNGPVGISRITACTEGAVTLAVDHSDQAEEPWIDLLLALPRPKVMKRLWAQLAALGVGRIFLLNAAKVEKCYFSSQWLDPAEYRPLLIEGLMQCGTTRLPEVTVCPRFKPFIEDDFDRLFANQPLRLIADPAPTPTPLDQPFTTPARPLLAVGPEGGWSDYERARLTEKGFRPFSLGSRILRTDTACIALISVLGYIKGSEQTIN
ncbi:MAG: RNA methyltransferase [Kiritimatiellae bacterium]|nr:RNA methyltransferase [Kiritimatiellia bacterium]